MPTAHRGLLGRLRDFFALDDDWERPRPTARQRRTDVFIALGLWAWCALSLELLRSIARPEDVNHPWPIQHLVLAVAPLSLVWRRTRPLTVATFLMIHMFLVGIFIIESQDYFAMQCVYLFSLYSGVAWARSRRTMAVVMSALMALLFGSIVWDYLYGTAAQDIAEMTKGPQPAGSLLPKLLASFLGTFFVNIAYSLLGIAGGQAAWTQARANDRLEQQKRQIELQADELAGRKVVEERLRIARELHDVVAHHVSVMGVQAAAARRVLDKNPEGASAALAHVEESSRQAVSEMRGLLGTLRRTEAATAEDQPDLRAPQPGVDQIPALVQEACGDTFSVTYDVVEDRPGALGEVPMPVGLSLYRTVQEALANVRRHSTAQHASVVVRTLEDSGRRHVEAEVLDEGRPRGGTSGSGLGLLGMRERIASHGGTSEIGPRSTGGFRVRVRFPLPATS